MNAITNLVINTKMKQQEDTPECRTCGVIKALATASKPDEGLMWDGRYEVWTCQHCVKEQIKRVSYTF